MWKISSIIKNNIFVRNYLFFEGVLQIYEFQIIIYYFLMYDIY